VSDRIRLAVVGCGVIGRLHAEVIARHPDLSLTAVLDIDLTRAQAVAEMARDIEGAGAGQGTAVSGTAVSGTPLSGTPGPYVTDSLADLLGRDDVDAVAVAVPSGRHADISVQVLATGRHLVVEKPLEVTVARARLIAEAAAAAPAGTLATVISQHRFDPASVAVHDAVARGALGRLTSAVATVPWWRSQGYYDSGDWRGTWALDGGGSLMTRASIPPTCCCGCSAPPSTSSRGPRGWRTSGSRSRTRWQRCSASSPALSRPCTPQRPPDPASPCGSS